MGTVIVLGAFFVALGLLMAGVSAAALLRARREAASRLTAWGVVTTMQKGAGLRGAIHCPVVQFQTETGELVTFQSSMGGQPPVHSIGQRVAVFYERDRPDAAEIEAPTVLWLVPAGIFAVGLLFAAVGAMLVLGFGLLAVS
jgi:hypothetical protein